MSYEKRQMEDKEVVKPSQLTLTNADFTSNARNIGLNEPVIHVTLANLDALTLYLPNVLEARGKVFSISVGLASGSASVTLADKDESYDWSDLTLDANNDNAHVMSNGRQWIVIYNAIA